MSLAKGHIAERLTVLLPRRAHIMGPDSVFSTHQSKVTEEEINFAAPSSPAPLLAGSSSFICRNDYQATLITVRLFIYVLSLLHHLRPLISSNNRTDLFSNLIFSTIFFPAKICTNSPGYFGISWGKSTSLHHSTDTDHYTLFFF